MSASETLEVMRDNKEETKKSAAAEAKRRRMVSGARNNVSFSRALSRAALRSLTAFEGLFVFAGRDFAGDFFGVGFGDFVAGGLGDAARRGDFAARGVFGAIEASSLLMQRRRAHEKEANAATR